MTLITKRDDSTEELDVDKFNRTIERACKNITGVSHSELAMAAGHYIAEGMTTSELQETITKAAADLITEDTPNYQFVAAHLLIGRLHRQVHGSADNPPLLDVIKTNVKRGVYDKDILEKYTEEEINKIDSYIKYNRDANFTYAGIRQIIDKYLVQDRSTGEIYEMPQVAYIMVAMAIFINETPEKRLLYIKKYYDAISTFKINIPTPIMAGARTPLKQYASCVLVDVDDSLESIFASDMAIGRFIAQRAGIGINFGRIRGINSKIRNGEVQHTGVVPFLKKFQATVKCCTQNGIRGGSATCYVPIWHQEIEDILVLKNNKGSEDNRVRGLDYGIQLRKLFYERYIQDENITLFSPHDAPGLYESFFKDNDEDFKSVYEKYERSHIKKKSIKARDLIGLVLKERAETGRIYIMNVDHCNTHSSFLDPIYTSNLCSEITLPTKPLQDINDKEAEIATCILSAINVGKINNNDELEELCELAVRALDNLIDIQDYPVFAAEHSTKARRSLGIGYIGLAHYLAKNKVKYDEPAAWHLVNRLTEAFQYYLIQASVNLAEEKGPCEYFNRTKYSKGVLPIDTYKKDVDEIVKSRLIYPWEMLRMKVLEHGMRNSTLSAQMPSESSSVISNATNGIEPPRGYISTKKSKKGPLKQVVPDYPRLKNNYTLLWDMPSNEGYIKIVAIMQKYFDQAISGNWSYNPSHYKDNDIPISFIMQDFLNTYKYGWKLAYYQNTFDLKTDESVEDDVEEVGELEISDETVTDCDACQI